MTTEQLTSLAHVISDNLPAEQSGEFADILFDVIETSYSSEEVKVISEQLLTAGVDVRPICKRKHPT